MDSSLKVSVIGAGSSYTPELIEGFIEGFDDLPITQISLADIDEERLRIIGALTQRMVHTVGKEIAVETTLDRRKSIDGADFVINQIRVGGMAARTLDETIPLKFGVIGQETTGPGGFAKALRTIPVVLDIANDMKSLAPDAFLINFTNPAGLITEALCRYSSVPTIGLCNLPIGDEMKYAEKWGVERSLIHLDWVGLNHLNWTRGATINQQNVWPELFTMELEEARNREWDGWSFSADILETLGMIPCGYLNYYYNHDLMLKKQKTASVSRGAQVKEIEKQLMEMYQDPDLKEKPKLLEQRGGAYYSKVAVSLIAAIANNKKEIHIVNTLNRGAIPNLPHDVVVEVPCLIDATGAKSLKTDPLPPEIRGLVQAVKAFEELTLIAGVEGDRRIAIQALLAHPLIPSYHTAKELTEALLEAHQKYLPQFFAGG